jgi:hypothetical protein
VAISRENLARVLVRSGQTAEAVDMLSKALTAHQEIAARDKSNAQSRCDSARVSETLADTLAAPAGPRASPPAQSCVLWRESLHTRQALVPSGIECAGAGNVQRLTARLADCR